MIYHKVGDWICFTKDLTEHVGADIIIKADIPVLITKINKHTVWFRTPNNRIRHVRYIPERMYFATDIGKVLYANQI